MWFEKVKSYTERLVAIRSVSPGAGEVDVAHEILRLLHAEDLASAYTESGLDPLEGDPFGRCNVYAFVRGVAPATLVLLGHFDTVDTTDYAALEPLARNPAALAEHARELGYTESPEGWMFGRGAADMKSGVAVILALIRYLAQQETPPPLSVLMLATADEENESAGVLQAVHFLQRLRQRYGLTYLGVINTDYTTARYPGDPHRCVYAGTVGKLLPGFFCIGEEGHVGAPFAGLDANVLAAELIRDLSMNVQLCEEDQGEIMAPPVTLHATDLKAGYNVQLPFTAYFYLNYLTLTSTPATVMNTLRQRAEAVMQELLKRIEHAENTWLMRSGVTAKAPERVGCVLTYSQLVAEVQQRLGADHLNAELVAEWESCPAAMDSRERSVRLVQRLWRLSGRTGPAIVLFFAPPYYPHVPAAEGLLSRAIQQVIAAHPEMHLELRPYFPYLSDVSFLCLPPECDPEALIENMPAWQKTLPDRSAPRMYQLPLREIQQLNLPVFNWGVYGHGVHQRDERVLMSYSFEDLPALLLEVMNCLAKALKDEVD
ncbi:arginine utilization protein RocB [Thermosporothrix hazakensis]|jgi:arginine utilization protein RocB|uniref:Arginine utilization protein RocB n=2 Tax=Thermosporothrix TaxID=768650 RepID=A0A326U607_THEHA|nr:M20/M25/M40 family metallo-hydrolase [Thermosporothrix hazakensis]PZW25452.1 arginine utilization protein RocB [Thermosporothrix hazakensis]BBH90788.1 peptidase M20 [Thermosporothrix sp. COM3]GCE48838.1 peptidase M20 [Thermosporothrix hazakensis]